MEVQLSGSDLVPLIDTEKDFLKEIYSSRLRWFFTVITGLMLLACLSILRVDRRTGETGDIGYGAYGNGEYHLSHLGFYLLAFAVLPLPICAVGWRIYYRRIYSLKKDIRSGMKCRVWHTVTMKQYFANTGQYFIGLNNPDYLHHEVDSETYARVERGGVFPIFFARYSKQPFTMNGRYELM